MDRFLEEVVVKKNKTFNEVMYVMSLIVMVLMAIIALLGIQLILYQFSVQLLIEVILCAAAAVVLFLFRDRLRTEYEYTFTNGDMDFAMVFNNQKRKSLGSLKVRTVEAFGPVSGSAFQRYVYMPGIKTTKWFLNRGAHLYYFYFQKESAKRLIIIEPSEEMVADIKQFLPRGAWQE